MFPCGNIQLLSDFEDAELLSIIQVGGCFDVGEEARGDQIGLKTLGAGPETKKNGTLGM